MTDTVLAARSLSVRFGGVHALVDVDLEVPADQLVGLIGPNGAGKTTFIDAVTGFVPYEGRVEIKGRDVSRLRPHTRARRGLARTWQAVELFDDLNVAENLAVPASRPSLARMARDLFIPRRGIAAPVAEALALVDIEHLAEAMPTELSQGQRKLVGVARALAARPEVLCLDEPVAGLNTIESVELGKRLRSLVDGGLPMLLVDHDMGLVLSVCDRVVVLEFGKVIANGPPDDVRRDPQVVAAYLGSAHDEAAQAAVSERRA